MAVLLNHTSVSDVVILASLNLLEKINSLIVGNRDQTYFVLKFQTPYIINWFQTPINKQKHKHKYKTVHLVKAIR